MFKFVSFFACISVALAIPGHIAHHHTTIHEPVLTKVGSIVHTVPSAVSHQSITRIHNEAVVTPVVAPVVKSTVHTVESPVPVLPVVKTVNHVVPVVKTKITPIVHHHHAAHVVPAHTQVLTHAVHHQPLVHHHPHSSAAIVSPVVKSVVAPAVSVVHAAPISHHIHH